MENVDKASNSSILAKSHQSRSSFVEDLLIVNKTNFLKMRINVNDKLATVNNGNFSCNIILSFYIYMCQQPKLML